MSANNINKGDVKLFLYNKIKNKLPEVSHEFKNASDTISAAEVRCLAKKLLKNYNSLQRFASLIEFLDED